MAEVREAKSNGTGRKRGPISKKNLHHLEIHPSLDGSITVMHHRNTLGQEYTPPEAKSFSGAEAAVKHIASMLGVQHSEPGEEDEAQAKGEGKIEAYDKGDEAEEGED